MNEVVVDELMRALREILDFDPAEKQYTKLMGQKMMVASRQTLKYLTKTVKKKYRILS